MYYCAIVLYCTYVVMYKRQRHCPAFLSEVLFFDSQIMYNWSSHRPHTEVRSSSPPTVAFIGCNDIHSQLGLKF